VYEAFRREWELGTYGSATKWVVSHPVVATMYAIEKVTKAIKAAFGTDDDFNQL